MSSPINYTQYLKNPEQKQAFLTGCKAMAAIVKTANSDDVTFLVSNPSDDRILSLVLDQQDVEHNIQHHDAATIIQHSSLKESEAAAMVLGFMVNDTGYATDEDDYVVEDGDLQIMPGKARRPWPYTLAQNKQTAAQISIEEYNNLAPEQQADYDVLRYLDLRDGNDIVLKRIVENDHVYMAELLRYSIGNGRDSCNIFRYLCECGSGHGELPRGRFYDYRKEITAAARKLGLINIVLAIQINEGYVNTVGQYYLAWLQTMSTTLTPGALCGMTAYQLATLKILLTTNTDEMAYDITDDDVRLYRDARGNGMKGLIYREGDDINNYPSILPASAPECDIYAQKNYICNTLIPRTKTAIIRIYDYTLSREDAIDMDVQTMNELMDLIGAIGSADAEPVPDPKDGDEPPVEQE